MRFPVCQLLRGGLDAENNSGVDINGLAANGTTFIVGQTPPGGLLFWPSEIFFGLVSATGLVSLPVISLGTGGNFTDIMAATQLTGLSAAGDFVRCAIAVPSRALNASQNVTARIVTAGSGGSLVLRPAMAGFFR